MNTGEALHIWLVQRCIDESEPCIPVIGGEPWVSIRFAAGLVGYEPEYFARLISAWGVPRHPHFRNIIRLSDLEGRHEQHSKDTQRVSDTVSS